MSEQNEQLAALKAAAEAATPGPWRRCVGSGATELRGEPAGGYNNPRVCRVLRDDPNYSANVAFIAAANPAAILALIEEVEAARRAQPAPTVQAEPAGWREFIENIAKPYSEPLNSVSGYRDKASRKEMMGVLRRKAQDLLAAAPAHASSDGRDAILEEAAKLCESLRVKVETSRPYSGEQEARNDGLDEAAEAIRALAGTGVKKGGA